MLQNILFIARHDIRHMMKSRETLMWTFVMPILFMYFIGTTISGMGPVSDRPVHLALVVEAKESGFLVDEIVRRLEEQKFVIDRPDTAEKLAAYTRRLTIPAPKGDHASFTAAVLAGEEMVLKFFRRGSSEARDLDRVKVYRAVYTVLADLAVTRRDGDPASAETFQKLRDAPRSIKLTVKPAGKRKTVPTGYDQSIPGTMIMFTMMILLTGGASILVLEREQGLLRRLASTPISRGELVLGKWIGKLLLAVIQLAFAVGVSLVLFDMDWGPEKFTLGVVLLSWAAFNTSFAIFLTNLARSESQMSGIGVIATMTMAALGGCWWPIEITPDWMQSLATCLPTGWAMDAIHHLVSFHDEASTVIPNVLGLLTGALVLGWFAQRGFRYQ